MNQQQFRHEIKYLVNLSDYHAIRSRLKHLTLPDPFASEDGTYRIRSLYFDNPDNKALLEKMNGIGRREKFRLRYYNQDPSMIKLEKKCKVNTLCTKQAVSVSRQDCERMLSGDTAWMPGTGSELLAELYAKMTYQFLRPKTVVDYTREAYLYKPGNVRITMDRDLRSGLSSRDFFNRDLPTAGISSGRQVILEVKFDAFLPDIIRDTIQTNERRSTSISKYAACRIYG